MAEKATILQVLEILKEYSDENHILPMRELQAKMLAIYASKPDRRTIYGAIDSLLKMGYDISIYEENQIGYYYRGRIFENAEINLLIAATTSFPFISVKQSEELMDKLKKQLSVHQRKNYHNLQLTCMGKKTDNRQVFLNIELLYEAIKEKKMVQFTYLQYGLDKKLHPRREKAYVVNPYEMIYANEHYYLSCNLSGYPDESFYRIDLMEDMVILEQNWDKEPGEDDTSYNAVYAYAGVPERISMYCDRKILGNIIDKFGTDISVLQQGDGRLWVSFQVSPQGVKYWALQFLPYVEIVEPKWLRAEIVESIKENRYGV